MTNMAEKNKRAMAGRLVRLGIAAAVLGFLAAGCATTDKMYRGLVKVTNPDAMTLQGGVRWLNPMPNLRPAPPEKRVVYLRWRNTSGSPLPNLQARIQSGLETAGYRVTDNPDAAHYIVEMDARYFGENRRKDGGNAILAGTALGAIPGAVLGHNLGRGGRGRAGAMIGATVGAAIGNILANRNKMVEYDLVVDVRIGERIPGGVKTTLKSKTDNRVSHADSSGHESSRSRAGSGETQAAQITDSFLYHKNRVVCHVQRMALTPEEALPYLEQRLIPALSSVLP